MTSAVLFDPNTIVLLEQRGGNVPKTLGTKTSGLFHPKFLTDYRVGDVQCWLPDSCEKQVTTAPKMRAIEINIPMPTPRANAL